MKTYRITVINRNKKNTLQASDGQNFAGLLSDNGYTVSAACGHKGSCGKCRIRLLQGTVKNEAPDENGTIRSCKATVCSDAVVDVTNACESIDLFSSEKTDRAQGKCGIAVDIGTTTVAATFLMPDGTVKSCSRLNPQSCCGADVISRIEACSNGQLNKLHRLIVTCINEMIASLDEKGEAKQLIVSGNTVMLHIFCSVSPESMGVSPFKPQFTEAKTFSGKEIGIPTQTVHVLPSVSAFIGGDTVSGIYALGLHKTGKRVILADLGTNGEIVFSDKGKLFCTSAAAGPALEGACIECGTGGIGSAVNKVYIEDSGIGYTTVSGEEPTGICGAGLTDAVAVLLKSGKLDSSGYLEESFVISEKVYISQNDIRQFQLAKSAICSAVEILLEQAGITPNELDTFYIAGGLGCYIDPESAFTASLIPRTDKGKTVAAGNTSLKGAMLCIENEEALSEMSRIAESCGSIDLNSVPSFGEKFMENMFFH